MFYVYSIETDTGHHYVGCTKNLRDRMGSHRRREDATARFPDYLRMDFVVLFKTEDEIEALKTEAAYIERAKLAYGDKCVNRDNRWLDASLCAAEEPEEIARFRLEKAEAFLPYVPDEKTALRPEEGPSRGWEKVEGTLRKVTDAKGVVRVLNVSR